MMAFEPNPSLFREMSKPFASVEAANEALQAFQTELAELRKKHKITTLLFTVLLTALTEEGEEGEAMICGGFGDAHRHEAMAAFAHGRESAERQERIMGLLAQGIKSGKKQK